MNTHIRTFYVSGTKYTHDVYGRHYMYDWKHKSIKYALVYVCLSIYFLCWCVSGLCYSTYLYLGINQTHYCHITMPHVFVFKFVYINVNVYMYMVPSPINMYADREILYTLLFLDYTTVICRWNECTLYRVFIDINKKNPILTLQMCNNY